MKADALLGRIGSFARSSWQAVVAQAPRLSHPLTGYLLVFMVLAGIVLRIQNVGYPFRYGFDEHQYAGAAHQFLIGVPDTAECCHPPLSKLLIGVGMVLEGDTPLGWRFVPLCLGIQNIVLVFLIATSLFGDRRAGWLAAAFMAADGFYLSYSRASLPDMSLATMVLWSMLAAVTARGWGGVLACAVLVGTAVSIKWVGILVILPACFALLILRRVPWYSLVCFAAVPFVHVGLWMIGLKMIGHASDVMSVFEEARARAGLHLGFPHQTNPAESLWYTWLVMYHPLVIKSARVGASVRLASSVGNPLLWIAADACLVALPLVGGVMALRAPWRERWRKWFDVRATKALAILGVSWLSMMLLWMSERIVTYWYHYLTPWGFAILIVAGVVACFERRFPKGALVFVMLVLAVFVYFAPVWAEIPISRSAARWRLIFPTWW
jgi:dolichyl-phosphate-mannose-protein mannosyltransferase